MTAATALQSQAVDLPNFLIVGAAKSGTTSLHHYLKQHPEVFFPKVKEPNYFALAGAKLPPPGPADADVLYHMLYTGCITDFDEYCALFRSVQDEKAIGESSVRHLYFPEAPPRIKETLPDVRLVMMLREPVSRLFSHYNMMVQFQLESLSLVEAIAAEEARYTSGWGWDWHYIRVGRYAEQLSRYLEFFDRDQIKIILYDDFVERPIEVFQEVCRYLNIDDQFQPDMSQRENVTYRPKSKTLYKFLHWPNKSRAVCQRLLPGRVVRRVFSELDRCNRAPIEPLGNSRRRELEAFFHEDVQQLEDLLSRKVPWYR